MGKKSKSISSHNGSHDANKTHIGNSQLMKLFEDELKDIYWAEKALTKAIPKMIKKATSNKLVNALEYHLSETEEQVSRCEQIFESLGKKAITKKCEAMDGLIREAERIMDHCEDGAMMDAGIISAAQKVEHYEIASYGTLRAFAETLDLTHEAKLIDETLNEEKDADGKITDIGVNIVNTQAAIEEESRQ